MSKPVHVRVAEKIASAYFDDEERGYLFLELTKGQTKEAAAVTEGLVYDPAIVNDCVKLAQEDPATLYQIYQEHAAQLAPERLAAIEKQAKHDIEVLKAQDEQAQKVAFMQGVYQYLGFKHAAAQDQANAAQTKTASSVAERAPALAAAAGITR